MKAKDEKEIDEIVTFQANDEKAWSDVKTIHERAERGSREKFLKALSKVPKIEPDEEDKLK